MSALAVLVRTDLIAEIILRSEGRKDPSKLIEDLLESYLDRTIGDADIWSQKHAEAMAQTLPDDSMAKYGNPTKGYQWQTVHLPNATKLKMEYKSKWYFAEVRHQQVYYDGAPYSPSQFARRVANNTNRNAWNDIWIQRPTDTDWIFADRLRGN